MTERQRRFAELYKSGADAREAAIRAGYGKKAAAAAARRNLQSKEVLEYLESPITEKEILCDLVEIKDKCLERKATHIASGKSVSEVKSFNASGALKALELIGKHMGMFERKKEERVGDDRIIRLIEGLMDLPEEGRNEEDLQ